MSEKIILEGRIADALMGRGVSEASAVKFAHFSAMIADEIWSNQELKNAIQDAIGLREAGGKVVAGVHHAARSAALGTTHSATRYTAHGAKGAAAFVTQFSSVLGRSGLKMDDDLKAGADAVLGLAQNVGSRGNMAAAVLAVFYDRFTAYAKANGIELNDCSMKLSKLALNVAAAGAVGATGLGLVVAGLMVLQQYKDALAAGDACFR